MTSRSRLFWLAPWLLLALGAGCASAPYLPKAAKFNPRAMQISSPVFENSLPIPPRYTCDAANINPPLLFHDVPAQAKSLVLIMDDPDALSGDWVHWTMWNIDPKTTGIPENSVPPQAVQGTTDFGRPGYGGPCPPLDTHRYQFKLYALDTLLNLPASAKKMDIERALGGHVLATDNLIGVYQRQRK